MHTTTLRVLCALLGVIAVVLGYLEWGDWRQVIGHVALLLLAVVLWLALPHGARKLQTPTAGTRGMRGALYAALVGSAMVATMRWPAGLDDGQGSDAALVLMVAGWMIGRFLPREPSEATT